MFRSNRFAVLLAGVTLAFAAAAQPAPDNEQADPPSRVARLSFMHGDVSFVPAGENDWVQAQLNRPMVTGDKLWTDGGSRATLEIGAASIRMDQDTNFDFLNLDDNTAQMELTQGALNLRVRRLYDGQTYEVDTPTLAFVASRVGEFRINVQPNGQSTIVTVLSGGGDVYGEGGSRFRVEEGQSVTFNDAQLQDYVVADLPQPDAFDDFCHQRDRRMTASTSRRYVSEEVIGYEDLDDYGSWNDAPEYGHVWYPTSVAVGWSPYHNGHWGWVGAYGWSWVDDAPWGFAPFHYGRWVSVSGRWGWCPGRIDARPVYAPALVAFVGGSIGGVGVSIGIGGSEPIGWFPLGYGEPYIPSYHVSRNYFTNVNVNNTVINNTVINNYYGNYSAGNVNYNQITYANRNVAGAITAVPATAFVSARPVAASAVAVNRETFANARVNGFAQVAPTRASLAPAVAARAVPTAAVVNRPIVAATRPPAPVASFATRQAALAKEPGKPLAQPQLRTTAAAGAPAAGAAMATRQNLKVVTQGAPLRTEAPKIQVRQGVQSNPAAQAGRQAAGANATQGTAAQTGRQAAGANAAQSAAAAQVGRPATGNAAAGNAVQGSAAQTGRQVQTQQQQQRLNSSRFAHPSTEDSRATGNAVNARGNANVEANARGNANVQTNTRGNANIEAHRTQQDTRGNASASQSAAAAVQNRPSPTESHAPVQTQQDARKSVQTQQEYRKPVQTQQEYRKPVQTQQEYRKPAQTQQEYRAPVQQQSRQQVQQQQNRAPQQQTQQAQPRNVPQERKAPESKKKDEDKNGGGHR